MEGQRRAIRYEAFACSNPSCRGYRWADVARLRGESHCLWCNSKFKPVPELRPYYQATGAKGKGKGKNNNSPSEAKGGGKGARPKGSSLGIGVQTSKGTAKPAAQKVTRTFDRAKVDSDEIHKCRVELDFMVQLHGRESQKAQDAAAELQNNIHLRDLEKTPSQKATDKRRQLRTARKKLAKEALELDAAEEQLAQAHDKFAEAEERLETTAQQVDKLEEELQYLEEQYLRPSTETGPQRDLVADRAQEALDQAVRAANGEDEDTLELQQLSNRLQELLDKRASQPRKKTRTRWSSEDNDAPLPAVPEDQEGDGDADEEPLDERLDDNMGQGTHYGYRHGNPNPIRKTSSKILAMHSSKATLEYLHSKGSNIQNSGKGNRKGTSNGPNPFWGKGPTPAEAQGELKRPGLQNPAGGEGGGDSASSGAHGAAHPQPAGPPQDMRDDPPRNQGGGGPLT